MILSTIKSLKLFRLMGNVEFNEIQILMHGNGKLQSIFFILYCGFEEEIVFEPYSFPDSMGYCVQESR